LLLCAICALVTLVVLLLLLLTPELLLAVLLLLVLLLVLRLPEGMRAAAAIACKLGDVLRTVYCCLTVVCVVEAVLVGASNAAATESVLYV
jgi:hypothetical protein